MSKGITRTIVLLAGLGLAAPSAFAQAGVRLTHDSVCNHGTDATAYRTTRATTVDRDAATVAAGDIVKHPADYANRLVRVTSKADNIYNEDVFVLDEDRAFAAARFSPNGLPRTCGTSIGTATSIGIVTSSSRTPCARNPAGSSWS